MAGGGGEIELGSKILSGRVELGSKMASGVGGVGIELQRSETVEFGNKMAWGEKGN